LRTLTFSAVLSLPAGDADDLAALAAGEVAEGVVAGPAEHGAALAVVVLVTHEAVRVAQLSAAGALLVADPLVAHGQVTLRGDAANQALWVIWKGEEEGSL